MAAAWTKLQTTYILQVYSIIIVLIQVVFFDLEL